MAHDMARRGHPIAIPHGRLAGSIPAPRDLLSPALRPALRAALMAGWLAGSAAALAPLPARAQVPPSAADAVGYRGLHAAAFAGDAAALQRQLAEGAATDARDPHGRTPLHVATFRAHHDVIRALAKAGADLGALENDRYDAVTIASVANDEATLRLLLSLGASARLVTSRYDGTALIAAAHLGHAGVVRQLVQAGAPLDHVNNLHWTAVIESIVLGDGGTRHRETLEILIRAGASLSIGDRAGHTPLALARSRGHAEMVRMLEAAGAK
jgi:ankyrin repeat protein